MALKSIFEKLKPQNTIFYPGCLTKYKGKQWQDNYEKILTKIGIDFIVLDDLKCCGSPILNAGNNSLYRKILKENFDMLRNSYVTRIITGCPACYKNFAKEYKDEIGQEWNIEVYHASQIVYEAMKAGKLKLKKLDISITYHDPCHLGRHMGVYDEPRAIIKQITDDFKEMEMHGDFSFCCGGGGGVASTIPDKANTIAKERVSQALETKQEYLVTACPMCDMHLDKSSGEKIQVMELSELIVKAIDG